MMKKIFITVFVVVCCSKSFSQTDDKGIVLGIERGLADAITKHNIPQVNTFIADDATIVTPTGELVTKQQLIGYVQQINSVVVSDMQVKMKGSVAIITGTFLETGKDASGNAYSNKSRFTDVLEKRNGNWLIIASQGTLINQ